MPELTAELIADLTCPGDLDLSPDGLRLIYIVRPASKRDEHATSALWLVPVDGSRPARQFSAGLAEDKHPRWSPDGRWIAFLSDRAKRGTAQLYLIAPDGGEARPLTPVSNKRGVAEFAWSPDGQSIAFTSPDEPMDEDERSEKERDDAEVYGERWQYARLRLVTTELGEVRTLVAGNRHVVGLCWSPDGRSIAYAVQQGPPLEFMAREATIERIAAGSGTTEVICRFPQVPNQLLWSTDGTTILFLGSASRRPQSSAVVYAVPATGGEPRRLAFGDDSCSGFSLEQLSGTSRVLAVEARGLGSRICWLDPLTGETEQFYPTLTDVTTGEIASWSARLTTSGISLAALLGSGDTPPEIWAGRGDDPLAAPNVDLVTRHQEALEGIVYGRQEPFLWEAPDGWELDGNLVLPPGPVANVPLPLIVLVHGGPYGRWSNGFHLGWGDWTQWLATAGYAVLLPNPRGGWGHGERFAAAARGDVGGADYRDVMSGVEAAIARGIADPDRLGIGGWSQGGFMTAWAVTQTDRFKAGVMGAGVSDWGMMALTSDLPDFEQALGGGAPWDGVGPHHHAKLSPISFASAVTTPLQILHGERDARVPLSQATGFHRAIRGNGVPSELVVYPREPHGMGERSHQIDVLRRVRAWFDRWLTPPLDATPAVR